MKTCTQCGKHLPNDAFHQRSDMPWLLRADCKVCYNATRAKKRAERKKPAPETIDGWPWKYNGMVYQESRI